MSGTVETPVARVEPQGGKAGWDWPLAIFGASLALLAFLAGAVAMHTGVPPSKLIRRALSGLSAMTHLEDETLVSSLVRIEEGVRPDPNVRTLDPAAGRELLLVTGGPNQDAARCPEYGCLAWIMDREGRVLHAWPLPLGELFDNVEGFNGNVETRNFYPIGLGLMPDGSLVATFHARNTYPYVAGIARISWDGEVMWQRIDGAHHWLAVGEDGLIYAPSQERRALAHVGDNAVTLRCPDPVNDEGVRIYRPDGTVVRTLVMTDLLVRNGYPGLIYSVRDDCDPIHLNSVDVATAQEARGIPGAEAGDLLVSLREPSAIALLDPETGRIKHLVAGRTAAQHSAHFLPDGSVIAFDNQGGSRGTGGSRIMRLDLATGRAEVAFPRSDRGAVMPFVSPDGGTVIPSPDGRRAIVASKDQSRDFEIDLASGRPLWTMDRVLDVGPFMDVDGPVAGYFKAYGTYYLTQEQVSGLPLTKAGNRGVTAPMRKLAGGSTRPAS